jgi:hypothetical protein
MPYNETVIEDIPLSWIEWYTGWGFPNHSEFKPTYPKWWENMQTPCRDDDCGNRYFLRDVEVKDPFVDVTPNFVVASIISVMIAQNVGYLILPE